MPEGSSLPSDIAAVLWAIGAAVLVLLWRSFFPSYVSEKGKNLATKEDIAAITTEVERVKAFYAGQMKVLEHQNAVLIEELRSRQQLRLVATEKRLEAHQHAFTLWRALLSKAHTDDVGPIVRDCQQWWERNCLYLTADARDSFNRAYFAASQHHKMVKERVDADAVKRNWADITKAGTDLVAGVELPPLGEREAKDATSAA